MPCSRGTLIICLAVAATARASAAPVCASGVSLQLYFDTYGAEGCAVGTLTLSNFQPLPLSTGATEVSPSAVTINVISDPLAAGLEYILNLAAGPGELLELRLGFDVAGTSGYLSKRLSMTGSSAAGDGVVTVVEDACVGGAFLFDIFFCDSGVQQTVILFDIGIDASTSDEFAIGGAPVLGLVTDITVDGGLAGSAGLTSFRNEFTIPEPSTVGLVLAGVLVMLARRRSRRACAALGLGLAAVVPLSAANHREAPITALDHKADISDFYAFRSYDGPNVTFILCVDPLLEPANGPSWFPFDPDILYEVKIDNNNDAVEDIVFQFRFSTEQRLPNLFQVYAGVNSGKTAPANSPPPVPPGTLIVPPRITSFSSVGLGQRQSYAVTMIKSGVATPVTNATGAPFYAVPANAGPRTMDYSALFNAGIYSGNGGIKVFAGTTDDAFWIDLGGTFDTLNTSKAPPILSPAEDAALVNIAADTLSGFAVNSIAIEVPISMLTRTGAIEPATSTAATIGAWATTSRPRTTVRRSPLPPVSSGTFYQIQRMGNPLINELLVGTGFKDRFSMDQPKNDAQFASFFLDPALARVVNALTDGVVAIPSPPRVDLLPLVTYAPPIAAAGTPAGPVADLLRLNTGVPATAVTSANRLGLLAADPAGFPNGRRVFDDVTDIALRVVVGGVLAGPPFSTSPINTRLGDGVNVNDQPYRTTFPYLANAPSGRNRRHIDPGEPGCTGGAGASCVP